MDKLTIFTPTYNRGYILRKCYNSLLNQVDKNFEWLIIDDGSIDDTEILVNSWIKEGLIDIVYYKQSNMGKHVAHNMAVKKSKYDIFLILDSDDLINDITVETILKYYKIIKYEKNVSGIIGNKFSIKDEICIGNRMPKNINYSTGIELYQKFGCKGDTLRVYKTKILKENLFPVIENEKFVSENVLFDKLDNKYKMLIIHEMLYFFEYLNDGYSKNMYNIREKNPIGYSISLISSIKYSRNLKNKIKYIIIYTIWCKKHKINCKIAEYRNKLLYSLLYPMSMIFYILKYPKFLFYNLNDVNI